MNRKAADLVRLTKQWAEINTESLDDCAVSSPVWVALPVWGKVALHKVEPAELAEGALKGRDGHSSRAL